MDIATLDSRYTITVQEYIEIIRDLQQTAPVARVKEIAMARNVTRSSVSTVLNTLRELGLVSHEHYSYVALTEKGQKLGALLHQRHQLILKFLRDILKLDAEMADKEACKLEHAMSPEALNALLIYVSKTTGEPFEAVVGL